MTIYYAIFWGNITIMLWVLGVFFFFFLSKFKLSKFYVELAPFFKTSYSFQLFEQKKKLLRKGLKIPLITKKNPLWNDRLEAFVQLTWNDQISVAIN